MKKQIIKLCKYNKKDFVIITSISIILTLILTITLMFLSLHSYLVKQNKDYHVKIKTKNIKIYENVGNIETITFQKDEVLIKYNNIYDTYKNTKKICKKIKCQKITYNKKLLKLYLLDKKLLKKILKLIIVTLIITLISFGLIIKSSITLRLFQRKKDLSILKTLGATNKQIYKIVLKKVLTIFIISVIMALVISLILTIINISIINYLLKDLNIKLNLIINLKIIIIPIILVSIITILSTIKPLKKECKKSPIDIIKNSEDVKYKKTKNEKNILKLLAKTNYKRVKKRYKQITLAIFVSLFLTLTSLSYLNYAKTAIKNYTNINIYDGMLITQNEKGLKILGDFASSKDYKKYSLFRMCALKINDNKNFYINKKYAKKQKNLIILGSTKEGVINRQNYTKKENTLEHIDQKYLKKFEINGKKIPLLDKIPWGTSDLLKEDNIVMLTDKLDNYCPKYSVILKYQGNTEKIAKEAQMLSQKYKIDLKYVDAKKAKTLTQNVINVIKLCLYEILAMIITITIIFIKNIIIKNLEHRKQELKILKGIGIEKEQIKKIILYETTLIIKKGYILAITFSLIFNYIIYISLNEIIKEPFVLPFKEYIISLITLTFIIYKTYETKILNN